MVLVKLGGCVGRDGRSCSMENLISECSSGSEQEQQVYVEQHDKTKAARDQQQQRGAAAGQQQQRGGSGSGGALAVLVAAVGFLVIGAGAWLALYLQHRQLDWRLDRLETNAINEEHLMERLDQHLEVRLQRHLQHLGLDKPYRNRVSREAPNCMCPPGRTWTHILIISAKYVSTYFIMLINLFFK
ncbi:unnamed protein product [Meganyctiphanes norvegica]|uniref:Uncharacterized protein n=1 Tax=Meganyctiphanes norvegica TaxID=48144 RepID=A0AAV2QI44_MEGNR